MIRKTCCFSGHRRIPARDLEYVVSRLNIEVELLIRKGIENFVSGGAPGFDMIAASLVTAKREMGRNIRLIFALSCAEQDKLLNEAQRRLYRQLLNKADEIIYVSECYFDGCMQKRNRYMVDMAQYCICYLTERKGGTFNTVRYAQGLEKTVVNVAQSRPL